MHAVAYVGPNSAKIRHEKLKNGSSTLYVCAKVAKYNRIAGAFGQAQRNNPSGKFHKFCALMTIFER